MVKSKSDVSPNVFDDSMMYAVDLLDNLEDNINDGEHPIDEDINEGLVIFKLQDVHDLIVNQGRGSNLKPRLEAMLKEGNWRRLAKVTDNRLNALDNLRIKFPNFEAVIDRYQKSLLLASLSEPMSIYVPPILLVGEPGIGKTRFLKDLSETLDVGFFHADLATTTAGFVLAGSSSTWAEGKPGLVSDSLRKSDVANPIIFLDEIDKASGDSKYDPLGCLYSLLERETAKTFQDEALQVEMNCSGINWVASANYIDNVPKPIQSRFIIYDIQIPSREQMTLVSKSVYRDLLSENSWGTLFEGELTDDVVLRLVELSPREQKRILYGACCEVAFRNKNSKVSTFSLLAKDIILESLQMKVRTIGFY